MNVVGDVKELDWAPCLSNRVYRIIGKTNLTDGVWYYPTNEASRFFKVEVRLR